MIFIKQLIKLFQSVCISSLNELDSPGGGESSELLKHRELFVTKKEHVNGISRELQLVLEENLGIQGIKGVTIYNNYLTDGLTDQEFAKAQRTIFSEAPVDDIISCEEFEKIVNGKHKITIEAKPGQYDNRVDAVDQNITLETGKKHNSRFKKVVVIDGNISEEDYKKIVNFLLNPVESQQSSLFYDKNFDRKVTKPENHKILTGFIDISTDEELLAFIKGNEFSINLDDVKLIQEYFKNEEQRDPTMVELLLIDTYWSDHCRHTTFETKIDEISYTGNPTLIEKVKNFDKNFKEKSKESGKEGNTFMQLAISSLKFLQNDPQFEGQKFLDVSVEDNAASYKTEIELEDGTKEKWVIMFKNETHNSPTEVEPFGGAATCLGGAIRDTISGRAYTFQAMRISGSRNPTESISETEAGKLSQRAISIGAALGFSSYGNQIGLATGKVAEYFHPGYVAKRFEVGYVLAAVNENNFKREKPTVGDKVIMFGGRIGRDGVGGANVSSQESGGVSSEKAGSHVQKGNPIEERKMQRLLLNPKFTRLIKKSNDFGAGGVAVAIGELSRGIDIDLDMVAKYTKYEGLSDEELAISESQERMSIVVDPKHYDEAMRMIAEENLEAYQIAEIKDSEDNPDEDRLVMNYEGKKPVNLSRNFLDKNGAERRANAVINLQKTHFFEKLDPSVQKYLDEGDFEIAFITQLGLLGNASQKGLGGIFDNSVGASNILAEYGGKYQNSPQIGMASKVPTFDGLDVKTAIISTNGFDPYLLEENTFIGGIYAILESVSKIVALGGEHKKTWISLQEYFGKLTTDEKYGEVYAGLLGTLMALTELKIAAIGGKDSMSGTATIDGEKVNVPNSIISFANTPVDSENIVSAEFKEAGNDVVFFPVPKDENDIPNWEQYINNLNRIESLIKEGKVLSSSVIGAGGLVVAISNLSLGNKVGFQFNSFSKIDFNAGIGGIVLELKKSSGPNDFLKIGKTTADEKILFGDSSLYINQIESALSGTLEGVWPTTKENTTEVTSIPAYSQRTKLAVSEILKEKPVALIPIFPGTNSELDTKHSLIKAGFEVQEFVFNTLTPEGFIESRKKFAQLLEKSDFFVTPGGFSMGDEPDGSAKFIVNILKSPEIRPTLQRHFDNPAKLSLGICNGDQAFMKLGIFENGEIKDELGENDETITYNDSLRHQTELVRVKVTSIISPMLSEVNIGDEFMIPISHGEGKKIMSDKRYNQLLKNGQIAFQYLDENGEPTNKYNGSHNGIAGLTTNEGRTLAFMPHPERTGLNVFKNIPGDKYLPIFEGAFKALTQNQNNS